eukprot:TRINITY_DN39445_c0_g1_i1.p1 TRINITY_DN39445_c0_g1~~TRINITY_DN39445_c0_g1_i1.p1  ORF type:complete len:393 (+),score=62.61 TRINITY_DN39445_c0_g1_i1:69-1247(+)
MVAPAASAATSAPAATNGAGGSGKPLPKRPVQDLPADYCSLPGCQFSFIPRNHRAKLSLPPMRGCRSRSETCLARTSGRRDKFSGSRKAASKQELQAGPLQVAGCFGDYCDAVTIWPGILQDIDSSDDPWMREARALCRRDVKVDTGEDIKCRLMEPSELVECLSLLERPDASKDLTKKNPPAICPTKKVSSTLILEARNHPSLCSWLQQRDWRLDSRSVDDVAAASERLREDDRQGKGDIASLTDTCLAGLRYRLREVPVCEACFKVYSVVHNIVTSIRVQRRDLWAEREQQRRREEEECERQRVKQEETERMLAYQQGRPRNTSSRGSFREELEAGETINVSARQSRHRSLFLDADIQNVIHRSSILNCEAVGLGRPSTAERSPKHRQTP